MNPQTDPKPTLPIPIYHIAHHYYLYHAPTIAFLRANYHILGTLVGTLPQANQQNVFLGLPLSLLPEEVRVLCEKGIAFVVDDVAAHESGLAKIRTTTEGRLRREQLSARLRAIGMGVEERVQDEKNRERDAALSKISDKELQKRARRAEQKEAKKAATAEALDQGSLLGDNASSAVVDVKPVQSGKQMQPSETYSMTPASSIPPLETPVPPTTISLPAVPSSYPLYRHLHDLGYFMHPGLRFGCQYMAYPGDPLRFHSHFLVVSREWDQEIKLSTIIGSGRLGTGVKKGFLIGGVETESVESKTKDEGNVRCFSIEWGGM